MKVLHIIDSGGLYGAETMLLHLMIEQESQGLQPVLASIGSPTDREKPLELKARRYGLKVVPFRMRPGPNWAGALDILKFARKEHVEVLHSHGYKGNILFGLLPRALRGLPIVSTLHGWTSAGGFSRLHLYEYLESLSLRLLDRVVLVNEDMRKHHRLKTVSSEKLVVVENGIPPKANESEYALRPEILEFAKKRFTFGAIGRLSPEKGFGILLDTLAEMAAAGSDAQLVILGEGEERPYLEAKVKSLQLGNRVLLSGFVSDAKYYLPLFDAFIMTSLTEGLPMVLLEAMAAGIPIVATRVGGIPRVLGEGEGGELVTAGDVESLKKAMVSVRENPHLWEHRTGWATRRVREKYSSQVMAEKYSKIYESLIR